MKKELFALLIITVFLVLSVDQNANVDLASANPHYQPPIDPGYYYIEHDGSVNPTFAPIKREGIIYTLTGNITGHPIWIQYNGAILDGAGYTLKSNQSGFECGVTLNCTKNVTVKNFQVTGFRLGINVQRLIYGVPFDWDKSYFPENPYPKSSDNTIINCKLQDNKAGIQILYSSNNQISENTIVGSGVGIQMQGYLEEPASGNTIKNNQIKDNGEGILLEACSGNTISANQITQNKICALYISRSSNNIVSDNSITQNEIGVLVNGAPGQDSTATINRISNNLIAKNNQWGIRLNGSQTNNRIFANNFIDNNLGKGLQVSIPMYMDSGVKDGKAYVDFLSGLGNFWNTSSTGNYWSDYQTRYPNATETNQTGIGDTPFYINENNIDYYPVTSPIINSIMPKPEEQPVNSTSQTLPPEIVYAVILTTIASVGCVCLLIYTKKYRK